jgi:hypothetical protein
LVATIDGDPLATADGSGGESEGKRGKASAMAAPPIQQARSPPTKFNTQPKKIRRLAIPKASMTANISAPRKATECRLTCTQGACPAFEELVRIFPS